MRRCSRPATRPRWRPSGARFDLVFIDAPCTGTGAWRRRPDAKWRLKPANLSQREEEQSALLVTAAALVKPGGRLVYATCSVLPQENGDRIAAFLANHPGFETLPWRDSWRAGVGGEPPASADGSDATSPPHAGAPRHRRLLHRRAREEKIGVAMGRLTAVGLVLGVHRPQIKV